MTKVRKLAAWLIAAWFILVLIASALHLYRNDSHRIGIAVAVSAVVPIAAFALWYILSSGFREFVLSLNARTLTYIQSWRLAGVIFVILYSYGLLPAFFALPAGYGDMLIGATAIFAASRLARPDRRNWFLLWQLLGMADLVMAVTLGTTARLLAAGGPTMEPMTVLPLSLVPTFIVPLLFIFHIVCIAQARRWHGRPAGWTDTGAYHPGSGLRSRPATR